ncbi:EF-P beta-lysylation protein EpmB [Candidatus Berkiella aquae]|uniref:L-lysine 2,3-aminomutase n=1 Tax=Candidatus Berkiella aquae TaxID=295108 RepID=A0A0Q9YV74_9GAMM|nr:EF-P beta-lysylation protein EpmB [Candidatus Berkiella aquae]MCS5710160.1 EF-P beta-lysylation protein EpmB [Candidatus Berkiella aquae]
MITQPLVLQQQPDWQQALRQMITDPTTLLQMLDLSEKDIAWQWDKQFPLRVSESFVRRMRKADPNDPLLRQVLSTPEESHSSNKYSTDPLQEARFNPVPGLLHKYPSRVLITLTSSCAIHCRYCFRRHFPYKKNNPGRQWDAIFSYLENQPDVFEVILSGGDPLMASDKTLSAFLQELAKIRHIELLRFHTRLPVVIPERITSTLLATLDNRFHTTIVYHINHARELIPQIAEGVAKIRKQGIQVLNQSVLLRDINDNVECLKNLSLALFKSGIMPYYLHMLDKVAGSEHFEISLAKAQHLQQALRESLPGYLVPKFVKELPNAFCKIPLETLTVSQFES